MMARILRRSGESAIASGPRIFFWARLKLTSIYIAILAVILIGFSAFLYSSVARNLAGGDDTDFASPDLQQSFIDSTLSSVRNEIILVDLIILAASAGVSFVLAGYTLRPIQRALEAQQAFSENASHELRTPLAVIRNDLEVLLRNPSPSKELIHASLRSNIEEIDLLTRMTHDLLLLARSQTRAIEEYERINLEDLANTTVNRMRPLAEKKGIAISVTSNGSAYVQGKVGELERVFLNLLQNAIEHTSGGSLSVEVKRQGSKVLVRVSDTGSGIDPKDLPHVFERFYKSDGSSGSGLGLPIVKEIVLKHKGEVSIESEKGSGTSVTITLPLV